jgi:tetratricopeptide (TPR) repeat protein
MLFFLNANSQNKKIDSLKRLLEHTGEDTNRVNILYQIGDEYWSGLTDTIDIPNTVKYTDSALSIAKKIKFAAGEFNGLMCLGNVNAYQYRQPESKKYFNEALDVARSMGDKNKLAEAYFEIGDDYFFYGNDARHSIVNFPLSLDYYFKALKAFEETGNRYRMAKTWFFIGRTYAWQNFFSMGHGNANDIEKAVLNAIKLFKESRETTEADMAGCNFLLGRAYFFQGHFSNALALFFSSLVHDKRKSAKALIANDYLNIGRAFRGIADSAFAAGNKAYTDKTRTEALKYFNLSMEINLELKSDAYAALCFAYIGDIQVSLRQFRQAKENLDKAISYTDKLNGGGTYQEIYRSYAKLDSAEGNYELALKHYNMFMAYKENNFNEAVISESQNYRAQYEFDKREDSLKQKQFIIETKLQAQKKERYFYWTGIAMLIILSFFIFLNFRNQKKINKLAVETYAKEKAELELQSLRSQLNPHFIFNSINSIDAFIHSNDKYNATLYLNKFARLLRNILDHCKENTVELAKDIETIKLYIGLEELRNDNKFKTIINVDKELLEADYKVPPLIIQPLVENAILHGLKNKEDHDGLLEIDIRKAGDKIEYCIKDNGIGRVAAKKITQNKNSSYGMQLSYDRVRLFNTEQEASIKITDLYNDGIAAGTLINVRLKMI